MRKKQPLSLEEMMPALRSYADRIGRINRKVFGRDIGFAILFCDAAILEGEPDVEVEVAFVSNLRRPLALAALRACAAGVEEEVMNEAAAEGEIASAGASAWVS